MIVGAQAEGVGWARARSVLQWTGALGADPRWPLGGMRAAVAVLMPCSVRDEFRPKTLCVSASSGANLAQKGPFAGTVCCARKMQKVYWQMTFYTS